ncbi:NACHT, LRR and PYD domains-containing protein 10-like [Palaemon carinicauda]|uniref:NACHT, LRR and PYD domains-containing protein 10-like n=1 Tax=Palaemon carinicauda TaxID=392227 RepID=UPI0035B693C7
MKLEGESGTSSVPLEEILNHVPHYDHSRLLLIKGMAGMGKTTLVKKINSDWLSKRDDIKGLNDFAILLYVECRDSIESFKDLLVAYFGDVHQKFQDNEIIDMCLAYKCLLIIDGYYELNDKSSKLFLDVLTLKKSRKISVIVTTRPEFQERFNNQVKSDYTTVSTISLEGIPKEKREEFVCKYYAVLGSGSSPLQSLEELLQYLRKTKHTMHEVWGLPLNLALVTILWMNKPDVISNITTEAELYWQFYLLSRSKLEERLARNLLTAHLPPTFLKIHIKLAIEKLCHESFKALQRDEINIQESTINNLSAFCYSLGMPAEELTGAFLKKLYNITFQIPPNIEYLWVRFKDHPSLDAFCQSLEKAKKIQILAIRFSVNDVSSVSRPIPFLEEDPKVYVDVEDVKEEDIEKVGDILRTLQTQDARRSFWSIWFPLYSLGRTRSPEVILRLLASLKGVRVRDDIQFPEDERPDDEALRREMNLKAKESIGCRVKIPGEEEEEEEEGEEEGEEEEDEGEGEEGEGEEDEGEKDGGEEEVHQSYFFSDQILIHNHSLSLYGQIGVTILIGELY